MLSGAVAWIIDYRHGGTARRLVDPQGEKLGCLSVSEDGELAFSVGAKGTARLWAVRTGRTLLARANWDEDPSDRVLGPACVGVEWLGRGPHPGLATPKGIPNAAQPSLWLTTPPTVRVHPATYDDEIQFDPTRGRYVVHPDTSFMELRELQSGRIVATLPGRYARFSPRGTWLVTNIWGKAVEPDVLELRDAATLEVRWRRRGLGVMGFSEDDQRMLVGDTGGPFGGPGRYLLESATAREILRWSAKAFGCFGGYAWRPTSGDLIYVDQDRLMTLSAGGKVRRIGKVAEEETFCAFDQFTMPADGSFLATDSRYWRWSDMTLMGSSEEGYGGFSRTGKYLLDGVATCSRTPSILSVSNGRRRALAPLTAKSSWLDELAIVAQVAWDERDVQLAMEDGDDTCRDPAQPAYRRSRWLALTRARDGEQVWIGPGIGHPGEHLCVMALDRSASRAQLLGCDAGAADPVKVPVEGSHATLVAERLLAELLNGV